MKSRFAWAAVMAFLSTATAHAYIPPSEFMLKTLTKKRQDTKSMRIRGLVTQLDGEKLTGVHFKAVTVLDTISRVMKSRAYDDAGKELYAMERVLGENSTAPGEIVLEPRIDVLSRVLKSIGIPVRTEEELLAMKDEDERRESEVTFLSRWKGAPAWMIGPDKREAFMPQLWIEKDTFLPIRLIERTDEGKFDIRFQNYRFFRDLPYPRTITVVRASDGPRESGVLRDELQELQAGAEASELKAPVAHGFTAAGNAAEPELKELIRFYYARVR